MLENILKLILRLFNLDVPNPIQIDKNKLKSNLEGPCDDSQGSFVLEQPSDASSKMLHSEDNTGEEDMATNGVETGETENSEKKPDPEVKWASYKSWSGCRISGGKKYILQNEVEHMQRALWLTAQVEGEGEFGAINSYDGAGMSAGLEHNIAVYPKTMEQGPLWEVIRKIELYAPNSDLNALYSEFRNENWFVDQAGVLREYNTGRKITGQEIRNAFTPLRGRVPKDGPEWEQAKKWAILFYNLFVNEKTHLVQANLAIESLIKGNKKEEEEAYEITVGVKHPSVLKVNENISYEHDLAWCVYHSFSVNAPGMARRKLRESNPDNTTNWPKRLIRVLGTTNYGAWHDTTDGKNRYDRTRRYAMKSQYWPEKLFIGNNAIMPINL